jgi:hydrophobe/amphiphile efflux-1 (HAE1) family protein
MNPFAVFILRPVATTLLAMGALVLGVVSYWRLPIASLPAVERPTIGVWAVLPGASADTVADSLAQPLERQLGTIPGIVEMASFSTTGGTQIVIQFGLDKKIDAAATAVQAAIATALPNLPKDLPQPPRYWKSNTSSMAVVALVLTSETLHAGEVYEYADSVVAQQLARIPGVARVLINGAERGAVRIQASPRRLAEMGLSLEDIREAVAAGTANQPKGSVNASGQFYMISANDQLLKAEEYRDVVVAWRNGAPVRLPDVAAVSDDVINNKLAGWYNLERGVVVYVYKQMDANVVETVDAVKALLPQMERWIPPGITLRVVYDRTLLIRASLAEVQVTIAIAVALVMLVIGLFLKRIWVTLVPGFTIPVALAATVAFMDACGLSLDNLSLMALTIGIGFVVDDAVIVVESVLRRVESGEAPAAAALDSARRIGFTIVAISAALVAAMIPVLFMPDVVGRYFREFSLTLVAVLVFSAVVSLTLTPMLCSRMTAPVGAPVRGRRRLLVDWYGRSLRWSLLHRGVSLALTTAVVAGSLWLYAALPKGFMPTQDTGIITARTVASPNVSFAAMEQIQRSVAAVILADPAVEGLTSYIGSNNGSVLSTGNLLISLKPLDQRKLSVRQVINRLRQRVAVVQDARTFFTPWQDLSLGAQSSIARYQYTIIASNPDDVARWGEVMRRRIAGLREISDIVANNDTVGLEAHLAIDRVRSAALGVTPAEIDSVLYDAFGQRQIKTIYFPHNYRRVVLEVDPESQADPSAFADIYLPGRGRAQVPLTQVTQSERGHAFMWLAHNGQFPSLTISFDTAPGVSIGQALAAIRAAEASAHLPDGIFAEFRGEADAANRTGRTQLWLFLAAVFTIYVILGVLYESFAHPLVILSALPSASFGALLALALSHVEFTLITMIGCVLVIGMAMKNAIMMVDAALDGERQHGLTPEQAIVRAAQQRARPIIMTTFVAVLSAVPLALNAGPGHELRQPLGIAIIGGLLASQALTFYTTPVLYLLTGRAFLRGRRRRAIGAGEVH